MLHVRGATPEAVEEALTAIFAADDRPRVLRLEGTYSAVLARAADPGLKAGYRYLIFRAHDAPWVPVLEVGTRGEGLDVAISAALDGADVFSVFIYGDGLSGYRLARDGNAVDRYVSDPTAFASEPLTAEEIEAERGHPERFADLLPVGTTAEAFERVVLRQGWWEDYDAGRSAAQGAEAARGDAGAGDEGDEVDLVDEADRARCIALALELWGPSEYPFATDLEDLTNRVVGPALALAFE
jgi:hypothetical protein